MEAIGNFFSTLFSGLIDWCLNIFNIVSQGFLTIISDFFKLVGLDVTIPGSVFSVFRELSIGIGYIFPLADLLPIFYFWVSFYIARIIFAVFRLISSTILKRTKLKFK